MKEDAIVSKNLELLQIDEGLFQNGKKNGYCRVIDAVTGQVSCGFFKDDLPNGKHIKFKGNQILEEGIYRNNMLSER